MSNDSSNERVEAADPCYVSLSNGLDVMNVAPAADENDGSGLRFEGCCHPAGSTVKDGFLMTDSEIKIEYATLPGKPILDNHDLDKTVGVVEAAYLENGRLMIRGSFTADEKGRTAMQRVREKKYGGLSLGCRHLLDTRTNRVLETRIDEVSVCEQGQLPGTIIETVASRSAARPGDASGQPIVKNVASYAPSSSSSTVPVPVAPVTDHALPSNNRGKEKADRANEGENTTTVDAIVAQTRDRLAEEAKKAEAEKIKRKIRYLRSKLPQQDQHPRMGENENTDNNDEMIEEQQQASDSLYGTPPPGNGRAPPNRGQASERTNQQPTSNQTEPQTTASSSSKRRLPMDSNEATNTSTSAESGLARQDIMASRLQDAIMGSGPSASDVGSGQGSGNLGGSSSSNEDIREEAIRRMMKELMEQHKKEEANKAKKGKEKDDDETASGEPDATSSIVQVRKKEYGLFKKAKAEHDAVKDTMRKYGIKNTEEMERKLAKAKARKEAKRARKADELRRNATAVINHLEEMERAAGSDKGRLGTINRTKRKLRDLLEDPLTFSAKEGMEKVQDMVEVCTAASGGFASSSYASDSFGDRSNNGGGGGGGGSVKRMRFDEAEAERLRVEDERRRMEKEALKNEARMAFREGGSSSYGAGGGGMARSDDGKQQQQQKRHDDEPVSLPPLPFIIDKGFSTHQTWVSTMGSKNAPATMPSTTLSKEPIVLAIPDGIRPTNENMFDIIDPQDTSPLGPPLCEGIFHTPLWKELAATPRRRNHGMVMTKASALSWGSNMEFGQGWRGEKAYI